MARSIKVTQNSSIMKIEVGNYRELPKEVLEQVLGFSIGDSIKERGTLELELANDSSSDKEMNETIVEILEESGWKKC